MMDHLKRRDVALQLLSSLLREPRICKKMCPAESQDAIETYAGILGELLPEEAEPFKIFTMTIVGLTVRLNPMPTPSQFSPDPLRVRKIMAGYRQIQKYLRVVRELQQDRSWLFDPFSGANQIALALEEKLRDVLPTYEWWFKSAFADQKGSKFSAGDELMVMALYRVFRCLFKSFPSKEMLLPEPVPNMFDRHKSESNELVATPKRLVAYAGYVMGLKASLNEIVVERRVRKIKDVKGFDVFTVTRPFADRDFLHLVEGHFNRIMMVSSAP